MNIYFAEPSSAKISASLIYAWKMGLKTGQYYLRTRPARDAIQFTLDLESLDTTQVTKNLSKAEIDEQKKLRKRKGPEEPAKTVTSVATDLTKKRKVSETSSSVVEKPAAEKATAGKEDKPWENQPKKEEEEDYRWNICENC